MFIEMKSTQGVPIEQLTKGSMQRVKMACSSCNLEREIQWSNYIRACKKWNIQPNIQFNLCKKCSSIRTGQEKTGKYEAWNKGKSGPSGSESVSWKGGEYIGSDGYRNIYVDKRTYIKEHIKTVQEYIGREIKANECVHHIDGNKLNNNLSNLWLCKFAEHKNAHQSLQELGYELIRAGLIIFQEGKYMAHGKLCELLELPEEGNQQPSQGSNSLEGSTTRPNVPTLREYLSDQEYEDPRAQGAS